METFMSIWEWLMGPGRLAFAVLIGIIVSVGFTQAIKKHWQMGGKRVFVLAFLIGATATFMSSPERTAMEFWAAVAAGLAAPTIYKMFIEFARWRGWEWAKKLSGDGVKK